MIRQTLAATFLAASTTIAAAAEQPVILNRYTVKDPMVNNKVAGTIMVPEGWKHAGGMKWYPDAYHQVCYEAKIYNPNGYEQYEALAWCNLCWFTRPVIAMNEGSNYMGSIVMRPMNPSDVIEKFTVPTVRKGARVVKHHDMPEIAKFYSKANGGATVKAVRTRIEYSIGQQDVEEDIFLVAYYASQDIGGGNISTIWGPCTPPFAIRAAKGELDAATPKLLAVAHSGWLNPKWCDQVGYVQSLFIKRMYQSIADAGALSRQISVNNDRMLELIRSERESRWAAEDRAMRNFSDYTRGLTNYTDGNSHYTVPNTHSYVYSNGNGTVLLTNDPNSIPNGWTQLTPSR